jgi:hypothetical protein
MKAAFVLNFQKFTEWPATALPAADAPLIVAVVGDDPLSAVIKTVLSGKMVQGRNLEVELFRDTAEWKAAARPSQVLFVTAAAQPAWAEIRAELAGRPVLTISEAPGFCAAGGMLNLYEKENRLRFEANPVAVEKEGIKLRAELLKLATIVKTVGGGQ